MCVACCLLVSHVGCAPSDLFMLDKKTGHADRRTDIQTLDCCITLTARHGQCKNSPIPDITEFRLQNEITAKLRNVSPAIISGHFL